MQHEHAARITICVIASSWLLATVVQAGVGPAGTACSRECLVRADAVFAGSAKTVRDGPNGVVILPGNRRVEGQWKLAVFAVDHVIKGSGSATVDVTFFCPTEASAKPHFGSIRAGQRCVLFLSTTDKGRATYKLLDDLRPVLLGAQARPSVLNQNANESQRLQSELLAAVETEDPRIALQAMQCLAQLGLEDNDVMTSLKRLSEHQDPVIVGAALAARMKLRDATAIPAATGFVESTSAPEGQVAAIAYALRTMELTDPATQLVDVLKSKSALLRRDASYQLRMSSVPLEKLVPMLASCLEDSDREVQYNGVMGLARMTSTTGQMAPSFPTFLNEPERYVRRWLEWLETNKSKLGKTDTSAGRPRSER